MDYTDVQYLKSYVEFLGYQADRLVFLLDNDSKVELDVYGEGLAINIFPDGNILITDNRYDMKEEEYRETIIEKYSSKKKEAFIKKINEMLSESPFGPGGYPVITSYERAVAFLKMKSGQKS